ncbi:MAG: hypothetical protein HYT77_04090 [Deltaproteobacteria bacterium]|nr:hypothetical protein [Deltaproteobacteria bacterium]
MRSNENGCDYPSSGSKITMVGFGNCSQGTVGGDVRKIVSSDLLYAKVDSIRVIYSSGTANYDIDPTKYYNYTKLGITVGVRGKSYSWKDASLTESDSILEDVERGLRNIEEQIVAAENRPVDSYVSD